MMLLLRIGITMYYRASHTQMASHVVIATPVDTFVAIQEDPGRQPITQLRQIDTRIEWLRADGGNEAVDVGGSPHEAEVLSAFNSAQGLLLATYPDLALTQKSDIAEPVFVTISSRGLIGDDIAAVRGDRRGGPHESA